MHHRISRRAALQLGAGAGAAALAAPYLGRLGGSGVVDLTGAEPAVAVYNMFWKVPGMITRPQWGANEALRKPGQVYDYTISKIIVHHTGTPNSITNYAGLCRGILANETAGEYIDIAYNWLIDPLGNIYEGRWARDYAANQAHTGELNGGNVRGGHAIYHNSNTIGVALMGDYQDVDPPAAMIDALVTLCTWKCARWNIDPLGNSTYYASNGAVETLDNITGHRDTSATDCPGARTEVMLPSIRSRVAKRLSGGDYWIMTTRGRIVVFGSAPYLGGDAPNTAGGLAMHPSRNGYWIVEVNGKVHCYNTSFYGDFLSPTPIPLNNLLVSGIAPTASGHGYWLCGTNGDVHNFGDAPALPVNSGPGRMRRPIAGMTGTPTGQGYWRFSDNGDVWGSGDAHQLQQPIFHPFTSPVVALAARPQNDGYWLLEENGTIHRFGQAQGLGAGSTASNPVKFATMLPTPTGNGYLLVRKDGTVESFGDARPQPGAVGLLLGDAMAIAGRVRM